MMKLTDNNVKWLITISATIVGICYIVGFIIGALVNFKLGATIVLSSVYLVLIPTAVILLIHALWNK